MPSVTLPNGEQFSTDYPNFVYLVARGLIVEAEDVPYAPAADVTLEVLAAAIHERAVLWSRQISAAIPQYTAVQIGLVRRVFPRLIAADVCSPESQADTRRLLAGVQRHAHSLGVHIVAEEGSALAAEINAGLNSEM